MLDPDGCLARFVFCTQPQTEETDAVRIPLLEETNDRIGGRRRQKNIRALDKGPANGCHRNSERRAPLRAFLGRGGPCGRPGRGRPRGAPLQGHGAGGSEGGAASADADQDPAPFGASLPSFSCLSAVFRKAVDRPLDQIRGQAFRIMGQARTAGERREASVVVRKTRARMRCENGLVYSPLPAARGEVERTR